MGSASLEKPDEHNICWVDLNNVANIKQQRHYSCPSGLSPLSGPLSSGRSAG